MGTKTEELEDKIKTYRQSHLEEARTIIDCLEQPKTVGKCNVCRQAAMCEKLRDLIFS